MRANSGTLQAQVALCPVDYPAFLIKAKETPRSREMKNAIVGRGKLLGINVVNEVWADLKTYKACIAKACYSLSSRGGYFPVFFCNEVRQERFFDHLDCPVAKLTMPDVPSPVSRALEGAMIPDPAKIKSKIIQGGRHSF